MQEKIEIVDETDQVIDIATRQLMRKDNLLHRGSDTLVFNSKGEILVHKRTKTKDVFPSMWDCLCGGGVAPGESYLETAKRELQEETGIKGAELKPLFKLRLKSEVDNWFVWIYSCVYDSKLKLDSKEIEFGEFLSAEALDKKMSEEDFCPASKSIWKRYKREYL